VVKVGAILRIPHLRRPDIDPSAFETPQGPRAQKFRKARGGPKSGWVYYMQTLPLYIRLMDSWKKVI